ncbi:MAG TPA: SPOR domain-containing protein [Woeseiaceae bacterium]|nr:SPOR domain-containing protein [Woeseiaceae bacterium]
MKERIIGAAVLVVFVVLVVPVFLDGPPQSGEIVSERVPLPGQAAEGETRTVVLERDRDEPVPVPAPVTEPETERAQPVQPESKPEAEPETRPDPEPKPEPTKPAAQPPAAAGDSPTGMWAVQLGSFGNQQNAERLAADLRKQGFAAFLSQLSTGSGELHRVRIGPQKDRESAEAMAERLARAGHKGQVVPHP